MAGKIFEQDERALLIMLPYAGSSAQAYFKIGKRIESEAMAQTVPLDYAGHGTRFRSKLAHDFWELTEDAKEQALAVIRRKTEKNPNRPIVLFGHSMGALAAAYMANDIYRIYGEQLQGIIISSCLPPDKMEHRPVFFQSNQDLIDYLCMERNVPMELVSSDEFLQYILPCVRNDFQILADFTAKPIVLPHCPISCIWGTLDYGINAETMADWQKYSKFPIAWYKVEGTHFYFEENEECASAVIVEIINNRKGAVQ